MSENTTDVSQRPRPISKGRRVVISLLLLTHLAAIFLPPFSFQASGPFAASPLADPLARLMRPYIDLAFLNHGYAFFAPDPGPSHLIRAEIEFAEGREPIAETFPDLERQWPRLLYHRHFMLSEQLNSQFVPSQPPSGMESEPEQIERWRLDRRMYELKWKSFENHLRAKHNAASVKLTRVRHRMIDVPEFQDDGKRLDDPDTFIDLREDFDPAAGRIGNEAR
jgi:hypothetical protein